MFDHLKKIPLSSVFITIFGMVVGVLVGYLISIPVGKLPFSWSWAISVASYIISTVLMVFLFLSRRAVIIDAAKTALSLLSSRYAASKPEADVLSQEQATAPAPLILDTSAIIDGRIADIIQTGFVEGTLVVPSCILDELQKIADSKEKARRNRGRRGLEILEELKKEEFLPFKLLDYPVSDSKEVDSGLVELAKEAKGKIITTDYSLNKIGKVSGVKVLNVNELANMVKTVLVPGEKLTVEVIQEGKEEGQGVGYLPDGTMVVVEGGKKLIGKKVKTEVERLFQTEAGRMIFVRPVTKE